MNLRPTWWALNAPLATVGHKVLKLGQRAQALLMLLYTVYPEPSATEFGVQLRAAARNPEPLI